MTSPSIGIIGSGFGAIAMAVELLRAGHTDITLWERSDALGGVWRDNTYPGAACDVPSPLYSFSFEPNPTWSHRYAGQPEILAYLEATAAKYGITPRVVFGAEVVSAHFDEATSRWDVGFGDGTSTTVDLLISSVGQLSRPVLPPVDGLGSFAGTSFHSAQWDHDFDATGKRVAVIGTGASAIQFVPHLAQDATQLTVFQRSSSFIMPKPDQKYGRLTHALFRRVPLALRAERKGTWLLGEQFSRGFHDGSKVAKVIKWACMTHLKMRIKDPTMRKQLTPTYQFGCKRVLFSNNYYPAIARSNVELVTNPITRVTPAGVVTADGTTYDVDALVIGTGFDAQEFLSTIDIVGSNGHKLTDQWSNGARAYYGMYVPNFPNFFVVYGPNTNLGGSSIIFMLEAQAQHIRQAVDRLVHGTHTRVEIKAAAAEEFDRDLQEELEHSAWAHCNSWYRHSSGRITSNWPGSTRPFAERTKTLQTEDFAWS